MPGAPFVASLFLVVRPGAPFVASLFLIAMASNLQLFPFNVPGGPLLQESPPWTVVPWAQLTGRSWKLFAVDIDPWVRTWQNRYKHILVFIARHVPFSLEGLGVCFLRDTSEQLFYPRTEWTTWRQLFQGQFLHFAGAPDVLPVLIFDFTWFCLMDLLCLFSRHGSIPLAWGISICHTHVCHI